MEIDAKIVIKCPICGNNIEIIKENNKIRYSCDNCGADYGCDLDEDR